MRGAGHDFVDWHKRLEIGERGDLAFVAVREREAREGIGALGFEIRLEREREGILISAINEEIVLVTGRIAVNRAAAVERKDRKTRCGAVMQRLAAPNCGEQNERGEFCFAPIRLEKPARENG